MRMRSIGFCGLLFVALATSAGEIGPDDFRISDMGSDGSTVFTARVAAVTYNATENEFLVVWEGEEADGEFEIYGQRIEATTGAEVGTNDFRISDMGPNGTNSYGALSPAVVWNSTSNEYLVIWRGDDNTAPLVDNEMEVFGQRLAADGTEIGSNDFRISSMGVNADTSHGAFDPAVAYDPTLNQYLVVWRGDDDLAPNEIEIWGQFLSGTGGEIGTNDFRISDAGSAMDTARIASFPDVAYNATAQEYLVVWHADDLSVDNDQEIHGQRIDAATGVELGTNDFRISDMGPDNDALYRASFPAVAWNAAANEYLVVWTGNEFSDAGDFEFEIFGQRLSAAGAPLGTNDFRISDMGLDGEGTFDAGNASVAWDAASQEFFVVWHGENTVDGETEIWAQRIDGSGAGTGPNDLRLSRMGPDGQAAYDALNPSVAFATGGVSLTVWQADDDAGALVDDELEIYGQLHEPGPSARGDFNGDGKVDLLWRNYGTGAVNAWLMDGIAYVSGASLFTVADPNWRIEGTGDFNGDGSTDVIWRHYGTGAVNVWFLNGTTYVGGANLFTVADLNWKIQAAGDFNGDGKDDLIWRHYGTGAVNVWFLDGTTYLGGANLFTVADANWRIEVAGDFNGDGENDLIWRHYGSGAVNVWYLDGTTYLGGVSLFNVAGPSWDIEAVGDYNGDGKNDLIWRNYGTGEVNAWFLNGTTYLGGANLFSVADANWEIAGPR